MVNERVKERCGVYLVLQHQQHRVKNQLSVSYYNNKIKEVWFKKKKNKTQKTQKQQTEDISIRFNWGLF